MPSNSSQDPAPKAPNPSKEDAKAKKAAAKSPEAKAPASTPPPEPSNTLRSEAGRDWLKGELKEAERALVHGPSGNGWIYNEALRPVVEERVEFLRALVALLP